MALFGHSRAWHYSAETAQSTAALASLRRPAHLDQLLGLFVRQLEVHDPEMGALTNGCEGCNSGAYHFRGACQVTLQHAHIEGQPVAFEMRGPQLDNDVASRSAILC